jgi:hypothetical protein
MRTERGLAAMRQYIECDVDVLLWQQSLRFLRPFYQAHVAAVKLIAKPGGFPFGRIAKAVQIEVAQV